MLLSFRSQCLIFFNDSFPRWEIFVFQFAIATISFFSSSAVADGNPKIRSLLTGSCVSDLKEISHPFSELAKSSTRSPLFLSRWGAHLSPGLRNQYSARLMTEVYRKIPLEAFDFMAFMPQTSQGYLLSEFPDLSGIERTLDPSKYDSGFENAKQNAWRERLLLALPILRSIVGFHMHSKEIDQIRILALSHLQIGLIASLAYGFMGPSIYHNAPFRNGRIQIPLVDEARESFQSALKIYTKLEPGNHKFLSLLRYLLGKHAINAALIHSRNTGLSLEPDDLYFPYVHLARRLLAQVETETFQYVKDQDFPLYFEAQYHRLRSEFLVDETTIHFPRTLSGIPKSARTKNILVGILRNMSKDWINRNIRDSYGLINRLLTDFRWANQGLKGSQSWNILFNLQMGKDLAGAPLDFDILEKSLLQSGLFSPEDLNRNTQSQAGALP